MPATQTDRLTGLTTSVAVKAPCVAVATTEILLRGLQSIGNVVLTERARVLVTANGVDNGIYEASIGRWCRAKDFDGNRDVVYGTLVLVGTPSGTPQLWRVVTPNPIVIGQTVIEFETYTVDNVDSLNVAYGSRTVFSRLQDRRSILDFGGSATALDNTAAFTAADAYQAAGGHPVYVPGGTFSCGTYLPAGLYYGEGMIAPTGETMALDYAVPTRVNTATSASEVGEVGEDFNDARYQNMVVGPYAGRNLTAVARATTVFGYQALQQETDCSRMTGFGKQVFRYATTGYSCDAFGADSLGQGERMNRCAGFGANTMKWLGTQNPVAVKHDFWDPARPTFVTAVGLDAAGRWPTIRTDFLGPVDTPNPSRIATSDGQVYQSLAMGRNALLHATKSDSNVAIGVNAMAHAVDNSDNTAVGTRALRDCVSGDDNVAIGSSAAIRNMSGSENVAIGAQSLFLGSHTLGNVAIGYKAAYSLTGTDVAPSGSPSARRNVYIGWAAGESATNGAFAVGIGSSALRNNSASGNVGIGGSALGVNTTGGSNTAVGFNALGSNLTSNGNTAVGHSALEVNTSPNNTAVGHEALRYTQAGGSHIGYQNCTGIGYRASVSGDNQVQLGNSDTTTYTYGSVQNRSDARDKTDVRDTTLGLEFIQRLRPVDFKWDYRDDYENGAKDGSKKRYRYHHGLIAQEVRGVCASLGIEFGGLQDHAVNGGADVLTIGYSELIGPLIAAVKELAARVEALEAGQE